MKKRPGRPQRLPAHFYVGERSCAFTACLFDRTPLFLSEKVVEPQIEFLRRASREFDCTVLVYCFMPDHLHVMFRGISPKANCLAAMTRFKLLSGLWMDRKKLLGWQGDFYDDLISGSREWRGHAMYIVQNPVRAGLVENPIDYPFLGSLAGVLGDIVTGGS